MVSYSTAATTYATTISGNTFDTTLGGVADTGINVTGDLLTISGNTFTVDMTATDAQDVAIATAGGSTDLLPITISGNTITGASGNGVLVTAGNANLSGNTMSGLWLPLDINDGAVTVKDETITASGIAISATLAQGIPAVDIAAGVVTITNSTISDSAAYAVNLSGSPSVNIMFNQITGNAKNVYTAATVAVNATHNWWGDATGPATGTIVDATPATTLVDTTGYLGAASTGTFNAGLSNLLARTTAAVDVTSTPTLAVAPAMIGVANYAANPQGATPDPAITDGFYDVYLAEVAAGWQR